MIKLNSTVIIPTIFPDNTSQVWKIPPESLDPFAQYCEIYWDFLKDGCEAELIWVAQLVDLIPAHYKIVLYIPYLPYARQDKEVGNLTTFALTTFAKLLNAIVEGRIFEIRTVDVHSSVATGLIPKLISIAPIDEILFAKVSVSAEIICYPDSGASERYKKSRIINALPSIALQKNRDPLTGKIEFERICNYQIDEVKGNRIILVDDLCDGGGTFILAAKSLYEAGAKEIHLYVTHGIFSKGTKVLEDAGIKRIFTYEGEIKCSEGT